MAPDMVSIWVSLGLMLFFMIFGQLMLEVKPMACPWEDADPESPAPQPDFEVRSRRLWRDWRPSWGARDLHSHG